MKTLLVGVIFILSTAGYSQATGNDSAASGVTPWRLGEKKTYL